MNLKKDLTIDILSSVQKPARYTGGEFASIVKPADEVEATIALAFPDVYEVGMSYLGFKILYHLLNKEDGMPQNVFTHPGLTWRRRCVSVKLRFVLWKQKRL